MRVHISAPATTANLGPGFDCLGAALDLHLEIEADTNTDEARIEVEGEGGAGELPTDETNLVFRAARCVTDSLPPVRVRMRNPIPLARGLGSSSAAIAAGLLLGCALSRSQDDRQELLRTGLPLEGHADNLAPCLLGGLVLIPPGQRPIRFDPPAHVRPLVFAPETRLETRAARGALPATVPHADAVASVGRAAALVAMLTGVAEATTERLLASTEDVLHQPYRAPLMPDTARALARLRNNGIAAVVSGAGPSILCLLTEARTVEPPAGWRRAADAWSAEGARMHVVENG